MEPDTTGYADVNGLHLYYETYGEGPPLVLLHAGMMTIEASFAPLIPALAQRFRVIGVEAQGHGRTANIDRPITYVNLAADVVALLDHLGIDAAHVMGHSTGAGTVLELITAHGDRVLRAVPLSGSVRADGMVDFSEPGAFERYADKLPTEADLAAMREGYERLSPHPERFDEFFAYMSTSDAGFAGWTDEQLAGVTASTLIVQGDNDFATNEHAALMKTLIPGSQLLILPGTTHMGVPRRVDLLLPALESFLG
ncbi:alpha/beta fold hydrolase [Spongisporangium articulatum]|uniref:Alpha/beta fold hydrolase n=1 Tax=Spongisporangium articulatum TaxID=3362603 RepID=A0ABW8AR65_9ACTN